MYEQQYIKQKKSDKTSVTLNTKATIENWSERNHDAFHLQLTAVRAVSDPLFPALPPARFTACKNLRINSSQQCDEKRHNELF